MFIGHAALAFAARPDLPLVPGSASMYGLGLWNSLAGIRISGPFSPPPPDESAIAAVGLLAWLIPLCGHWADRHRLPRTSIA